MDKNEEKLEDNFQISTFLLVLEVLSRLRRAARFGMALKAEFSGVFRELELKNSQSFCWSKNFLQC